jgi:hypothetical protein
MKDAILLLVIGCCCSYTSLCQTQSQITYQEGEAAKRAERKWIQFIKRYYYCMQKILCL